MLKPSYRRPDDPNTYLTTATDAAPQSRTQGVDGQFRRKPGRVDARLMPALAERMDVESVRREVSEGVRHVASLPGYCFLGKVLQLKSQIGIGR